LVSVPSTSNAATGHRGIAAEGAAVCSTSDTADHAATVASRSLACDRRAGVVSAGATALVTH